MHKIKNYFSGSAASILSLTVLQDRGANAMMLYSLKVVPIYIIIRQDFDQVSGQICRP